MSANEAAPITVAILTVSDSAAAGIREDRSGPAVQERCQQLGWPVVAAKVLPDDQNSITAQLREWISSSLATLILTTGGTGVTTRDVTPEATRCVIEKEILGISELMRSRGLEQTPYAVLSRALAGTNHHSLIVNLPGSPAGAAHSLQAIEHLVPHIIRLLAGHTEHS